MIALMLVLLFLLAGTSTTVTFKLFLPSSLYNLIDIYWFYIVCGAQNNHHSGLSDPTAICIPLPSLLIDNFVKPCAGKGGPEFWVSRCNCWLKGGRNVWVIYAVSQWTFCVHGLTEFEYQIFPAVLSNFCFPNLVLEPTHKHGCSQNLLRYKFLWAAHPVAKVALESFGSQFCAIFQVEVHICK
jgi:hypothetical protein